MRSIPRSYLVASSVYRASISFLVSGIRLSGAGSSAVSQEAATDAPAQLAGIVVPDGAQPLNSAHVPGRILDQVTPAPGRCAGSEHDPLNAVEVEAGQAHQARLERSVAGHLPRARPQVVRHGAERLRFRVPAGVAERSVDGVPALGDHPTLERDHGADRHVARDLGLV